MTPSRAYLAAIRLVFPTAGVVLALLYVDSTYGRIRFENLYYPYFVVGTLGLLALTIYADDLLELLRVEGDQSFAESVKAGVRTWKRSIGLTVVGAGYIYAIGLIGFFPATLVGMVVTMRVGGLRDPKQIALTTVIVLVMIYVLFVQVMGLRPPEGSLGL